VEVTNLNEVMGPIQIRTTATAKQAYESMRYQMILEIDDEDVKQAESPRRQVKYNFPEDFVRADEIKINIQAARDDIFNAVCGYMNYDTIFQLVKDAVTIFGKGKVTSNVIYGMGEKDIDVMCAAERLAEIGAVPNLRVLKIDERLMKRFNSVSIHPESVSPERMIKLSLQLKDMLTKRRLSTRSFRTMCFACRCCDLVPFYDV
jgi:biotin synthase-related radical SAM superfamily protein